MAAEFASNRRLAQEIVAKSSRGATRTRVIRILRSYADPADPCPTGKTKGHGPRCHRHHPVT